MSSFGGCLGRIFLVLPVAMLIAGSQSLYIALRNRVPAEISMIDVERQRPSKEWLKLKDAHANLNEAVILEPLVEDNELILPIHAKGILIPGQGPSITVLLIVRDPAMLRTYEKYGKLDSFEKMIWPEGRDEKLLPGLSVQGLVKFGLDSEKKKRRALEKHFREQLASDYLLIEQNDAPSPGFGWSMVAGALVFWGIAIFLLKRKAGNDAPNEAGDPSS